MTHFNQWHNYPWENGKYNQNERATLEDNYGDEYKMYSLIELLLEALSDRLLEVERKGTVYSIPICNIKEIYLSGKDCRIDLIKNGHYYVSNMGTDVMVVRTDEVIEVKHPIFKVV